MSATRVLAIVTFVNPVVPEGPVAVKLNSWLVELNASAEIVELDATEKTYLSLYGMMLNVVFWFAPAFVWLPAHSALRVKSPVAGGIHWE